jgi:hypothetical protein
VGNAAQLPSGVIRGEQVALERVAQRRPRADALRVAYERREKHCVAQALSREQVVPVRVHGLLRVALVRDRFRKNAKRGAAEFRPPEHVEPLAAQRLQSIHRAQHARPERAHEVRVARVARIGA